MPRRDEHDAIPPRDASTNLARLEELDGYDVAADDPDPRGWDVKTRDGHRVGEVKSLLVDREAMRVRFLEVELDEALSAGRSDGLVRVPVASARLDDDHDDVIVNLDAAGIAALGATAMPQGHTASDAGNDDRAFFGQRRAGREGEDYLVLREERLEVDTRAVSAGEVGVRKTVETERVRETVPVMREEVTVDRRPVSADAARTMSGDAEIRDDEIRVPVMAEEVVTEKRVVPTEEIVVRTQTVTEDQVVEADVRKERLEVDRDIRDVGDAHRRPR